MFLILHVLSNEDDREFFENLYRRFYPIMKYTAISICGREDADDLIQMTFLKLLKYVGTLRSLEENALVVYLTYTLKTVAIEYQRQQHRFQKLEQKIIQNYTDFSSEQEFSKIEMISVLSQLNERDRNLLMYRYFLDMKLTDIANLMGIPPNSIHVYLSRARQKALRLIKRGNQNDDQK